jgi:hypothetical protein
MARSYIVNGLTRKRAIIMGEIEALQKQLACLTDKVAIIDAALGLLYPDVDPQLIKGVRPSRRLESFNQGDHTKLCYAILREAGTGLTARQIAERIATRKNINVNADLVKRVRNNLGRLTRSGRLHKSGERRSLRWTLAPDAPERD